MGIGVRGWYIYIYIYNSGGWYGKLVQHRHFFNICLRCWHAINYYHSNLRSLTFTFQYGSFRIPRRLRKTCQSWKQHVLFFKNGPRPGQAWGGGGRNIQACPAPSQPTCPGMKYPVPGNPSLRYIYIYIYIYYIYIYIWSEDVWQYSKTNTNN